MSGSVLDSGERDEREGWPSGQVTQPEQSDVKDGYDKSEWVQSSTSGEVVSYILSEGGWWAEKGEKGPSRKGQDVELDLERGVSEYLQVGGQGLSGSEAAVV